MRAGFFAERIPDFFWDVPSVNHCRGSVWLEGGRAILSFRPDPLEFVHHIICEFDELGFLAADGGDRPVRGAILIRCGNPQSLF